MNVFNDLRILPGHTRWAGRLRTAALLALSMALFSAARAHALPLVLTPGTATFAGFNNGGLSSAAVSTVTGTTALSIVYKQNVGGQEEGLFAGSYQTTFTNTLANPSDGLIKYDGGNDPFITGGKIYLYIKDGTPRPWYLFDISSWNGTDSLILTGFYPQQGSISQISIFTSPGGTIVRAPEGGSTVALLGGAFMAVTALRRKLVKRDRA